MAIDATVDDLVELKAVPKLLQRQLGKRLNLATLYRWQSRGIAGIRLETVSIGSKRFTTRQALNAFFAQSTLAKSGKLSTATAEGIKRAKIIRDKQLEREAQELGI